MSLKYHTYKSYFSNGTSLYINMGHRKCIIVGIILECDTLNPICMPYIDIYKKIKDNECTVRITPMDIINNNAYLYMGENINGGLYDYKPPHKLIVPSTTTYNILPIHTCLYDKVNINVIFPSNYNELQPRVRADGNITVYYSIF